MVKTLNDVLEENDVLRDTLPANGFYKMLKKQSVQSSFISCALDKPMTQKARGLITLPEIFNKDNFDGIDYTAKPVNNIKKFVENYGSWVVSETRGDNTYNYDSPIEDYINFNVVSLVNPEIKSNCVDVVFFSCGLNLDPRGAYTKSMIAVFDNEEGYHYDLLMFLNKNYAIVTGSFEYNKDVYYFDVSGSLCCDTVDMYINAAAKTNNDSYNADGISLDTTEKEDIKQAIIDTLKEDSSAEKVEIKNVKIDFICETME